MCSLSTYTSESTHGRMHHPVECQQLVASVQFRMHSETETGARTHDRHRGLQSRTTMLTALCPIGRKLQHAGHTPMHH